MDIIRQDYSKYINNVPFTVQIQNSSMRSFGGMVYCRTASQGGALFSSNIYIRDQVKWEGPKLFRLLSEVLLKAFSRVFIYY